MAISLTYTFSAGTRILSSQVNSNFSTLSTRALDKTGDTMTGDLKFTDASYDIGKSGATRPRDFFLSRNAVIGGTLAVTGVATFTAVPVFSAGLGAVSGTTGVFSSTLNVTGVTTLAASTISLRGVTYTLPSADGSASSVLTTNGSATLSWSAPASSITQTFRGLQLRTGPDSDVAVTTVTLVKADEIIPDTGTSWSVTTPLTAAITASGAGGLDTGTEQASTWYEIYAIRKSSDATKSLLLHQAKNYLLDQSQTTDNNGQVLRQADGSTDELAQTFVPSVTGLVEFIDIKTVNGSGATGNVYLKIYATSAGAPTGAALATSDKIAVTTIATSAQAIRFIFRTPVTLTSGVTYAYSLVADYTRSDTVALSVRENTAGGYASGSQYKYNGSAWSAMAAGARDFWFKVYITQNDTSVTLPSGYDQKCKIGYVYNDGSSNFKPFSARDRYVSMQRTAFSTTTSTIPLLTDASAFIPPGTISILMGAKANGVPSEVAISGVPNGYSSSVGDVASRRLWGLVGSASYEGAVAVPIVTECQGIYQSIDTNTLTASVWGFEW